MSSTYPVISPSYFHGTRAELKTGDLIAAGHASNYGARQSASWVYLTGTLEAAIWGAELAQGSGRERIYVVEPTGEIFDDPNLTDQKFPGNPTLSYRSREPLRVVGEVVAWQGHPPERLREMKDHLQRLKEQGIEAID
jgi:rifampin ADP-ribosylating transferase